MNIQISAWPKPPTSWQITPNEVLAPLLLNSVKLFLAEKKKKKSLYILEKLKQKYTKYNNEKKKYNPGASIELAISDILAGQKFLGLFHFCYFRTAICFNTFSQTFFPSLLDLALPPEKYKF